MDNIRAIVFDLDNTLLHFEDYWETAVKGTFRSFHLTKYMNTDRLFDVYKEQDIRLCGLFDAGQITLDDLRKRRLYETTKMFNLEVTEQDYDEFQNYYVEIAYQLIKPNREYNKLLHRLSKRFKLAIMTNGSSNFQREKIKRMALDTYIDPDFIFISEEVGYSKPSPQIYQKAQITMNESAENMLFVGDSVSNEVIGPMNAGMKAIWVNKDGRRVSNQGFSFEIKDVMELEDILLIAKQE